MAEYVPAMNADELLPGQATEKLVDGRPVALYNVGGRFFATSNFSRQLGYPADRGKPKAHRVFRNLRREAVDGAELVSIALSALSGPLPTWFPLISRATRPELPNWLPPPPKSPASSARKWRRSDAPASSMMSGELQWHPGSGTRRGR